MTASFVRYPHNTRTAESLIDLKRTLGMMKNPYVLGFSAAIFLYVAVECAVYVWMPTLLATYHGSATLLAAYAISIFFVLRAAGRFIGSWILGWLNWTAVVTVFSLAILACFVGSMAGGIGTAVSLLPFSGLFMSVIYPTINSKGISCFRKTEHGAVAGVILFFTCGAAALGPLAMGAISDAFGDPKYGFILATGFAGLLFAGLLLNWIPPAIFSRGWIKPSTTSFPAKNLAYKRSSEPDHAICLIACDSRQGFVSKTLGLL